MKQLLAIMSSLVVVTTAFPEACHSRVIALVEGRHVEITNVRLNWSGIVSLQEKSSDQFETFEVELDHLGSAEAAREVLSKMIESKLSYYVNINSSSGQVSTDEKDIWPHPYRLFFDTPKINIVHRVPSSLVRVSGYGIEPETPLHALKLAQDRRPGSRQFWLIDQCQRVLSKFSR